MSHIRQIHMWARNSIKDSTHSCGEVEWEAVAVQQRTEPDGGTRRWGQRWQEEIPKRGIGNNRPSGRSEPYKRQLPRSHNSRRSPPSRTRYSGYACTCHTRCPQDKLMGNTGCPKMVKLFANITQTLTHILKTMCNHSRSWDNAHFRTV